MNPRLLSGLARTALLLLLCGLAPLALRAQALPTATGAGSYLALGAGGSAFPSDYDGRTIGGGQVFLDLQPTWHIGIEAESRFLRLRTDEGVDQTNYLAGARLAFRPKKLSPYVKFLVGATRVKAPFDYAQGTFFTYAPGAGVDCRLTDRFSARLIDLEYQVVPQFLGSTVRNLGVSVGLSYRINRVSHYPREKRSR